MSTEQDGFEQHVEFKNASGQTEVCDVTTRYPERPFVDTHIEIFDPHGTVVTDIVEWEIEAKLRRIVTIRIVRRWGQRGETETLIYAVTKAELYSDRGFIKTAKLPDYNPQVKPKWE